MEKIMEKEQDKRSKCSRPRAQARLEREAQALRKNLEKRKKQQEARQKLKETGNK